MPMRQELYPANWKKISMAVRLYANWTCQRCHKLCRIPGEPWQEFEQSIRANHHQFVCDLAQPGRFTLTVAHLDGNPANNHRDNLAALCSVCHLRHDARQHVQTRRERQRQEAAAAHEQRGQLSLF